jgi:hypothetical protein
MGLLGPQGVQSNDPGGQAIAIHQLPVASGFALATTAGQTGDCHATPWPRPRAARRRNRGGGSHRLAPAPQDLRNALNKAGVGRIKLFENSDTRQRLRAHDLRATFVTLALANGRTEDWVRLRTGHCSSAMIARYRREAESIEEHHLGWLLALHEAIPELRKRQPGSSDSKT